MISNLQNLSINSDRLLASVVTFYPDSSLVDRIHSLLSQFDEILIVDNTPGACVPTPLMFIENEPNVTVLRMEKNIGIASALNEALDYASLHKYSWLGTFDQDSGIPKNYRQRFVEILKNHASDQVAILAPVYRLSDGTIKRFSKKRNPLNGLSRIGMTMTSGNLVNVMKIRGVGGYDSSLFIDYVDFEICLRLTQSCLDIWEVEDVVLDHELGSQFVRKRFLWRNIGLTNHSPLRVYYLSRNRTVIYLKYWRRFPGFVFIDFCRMIMNFIKIILYESEKRSKLLAFVKGIYAGIRSRMGPIDHVNN